MENNFNHEAGAHLEIDGAKIYYEECGDPNAPALLFLHGGFGTIEDFNSVLAGLNRDFRIIGIDTRGHGKSTLGDEALTYERIRKDIESVLAHVEIDSLSIIGFSDGGIAAYRLAAFSSLKIEKLVTISSRWHFKNAEATRELFLKTTGASWREKFPETVEIYQKLNPEPDFDRLARSEVTLWLDETISGYPNEAVKNISCPVLITHGDEDHLISRQVVFELSEIVENSKLLNIPFAGHVVFEDQKEIFKLGLNEFLNH